MKKYRNYSFKKLRPGNSQTRRANLFLSLTTALLSVILSAISAPASALGLNCSVTVTNVNFGSYDPQSTSPNDTNGNAHIACTTLLSVAVTITTKISKGGGSSFNPRQMSSVTNQLNYNLYTNGSYGTVWGDGTSSTGFITDNVTVGLLGFNIDHTIYGRLPAGQKNARAGVYSDNLIVTVEYNGI